MVDLPEYYERPPRQRFLWTWTGDNFQELLDWLAQTNNTLIQPELVFTTIQYDTDGYRQFLNPGDMVLMYPWGCYPVKVTAEQLADGYAPIAERP